MASKAGSCILLLLCICWMSDARQLLSYDVSDTVLLCDKKMIFKFVKPNHIFLVNDQLMHGFTALVAQRNIEEFNLVNKFFNGNQKNEQVCSMCEQFTSQAISYLGQNKTQADIIDSLHQTCAKLHTFQQECITLVDYYAPLFFFEIASINPDDFCKKVNLCEDVMRSPQVRQSSCDLCHQAMVEILLKLKDPDTQLDIIEALLKGCEKTEKFVKQCKKLVFEYGPMILANAEQFLENKDLCVSLHICNAPASKGASLSII